MPSVISHYLLSKACMGSLGSNDVSKSVEQHSDVFYLGAQGPDFLGYSLGNKVSHQLDERMHSEGINNFFAECINRIRKTASHDGRSEIIAYIAGFICHYALDTCTHPYIYYKTGFSDENGRLSDKSAVRHHFLETTIDCILLKRFEEKNAYSFNIPEKISIGAKKRVIIGKFLSEAVSSSYGVFMYPEDYIKAMKDMAFVYRILRDKTGKKRAAALALGKVIRPVSIIAALNHYDLNQNALKHSDFVKRLDYLNEQHNVWHYPWDDSIDLNQSFIDLFNKAIDDSRICIGAFAKAVNKQLDDRIVLSILGNKNFSTGLENPTKFLYYNIDFQKIIKE